MLHITEDTPADMLSGAMDLTIHLPSGKTSKMCVERSTPMMDLLVQITTNQQLQITNYTLQPLQTAPNSSYSDKVLSYYPNTPIGALDTQHVRVVPKTRTLPVPKNIPPGHQPFESTFRMKVHLPRNQLYVTRVSRHVHIEDIMRKVCEEKNLDPKKYEVRHPGNLDEVLDPKLTLNDYMITEIYLIIKGSNSLTQAFSTNDIMALRKEEERKQMHNKTGGGVFNLIFRRGKSNTGSGSVSTTENSISPITSDDSRSVTPPMALPQLIMPPKNDHSTEKPKVPQRKRRPAPKPPQPPVENPQKQPVVEMRISSANSDNSTTSSTKRESNLTICHSRHSSDSSGYHETSILSDHCNTSLPRRMGRLEERDNRGKSLNRHSESVGNLTKMTAHSVSTSSLAYPGRKKKAPPPPPTLLQKTASSTNLEKPSPVVASQTFVNCSSRSDLSFAPQGTPNTNTDPPPAIRRKKGPIPTPRPQSAIITREKSGQITQNESEEIEQNNNSLHYCPYHEGELTNENAQEHSSRPSSNMSTTDILKSLEYLNLDEHGNQIKPPEIIGALPKQINDKVFDDLPDLFPKTKRPFKLDLVDKEIDDDNSSLTTVSPVKEDLTSLDSDISFPRESGKRQQLKKDFSITSLRSSESILYEEGGMKRWGSCERLDQPPTPPASSPPMDDIEFNFPKICHQRIEEDSKDVAPFEEVILKNWGNVRSDTEVDETNEELKRDENVVEKKNIEEYSDNDTIETVNKTLVGEEVSERRELWNSKEVDGKGRMENEDSSSSEWVVGGQSHSESVTSQAVSKPAQIISDFERDSGLSTGRATLREKPEKPQTIDYDTSYTNLETHDIIMNEIDRYMDYDKSPKDSGNSSDISEKSKMDEELCPEDNIDYSEKIEDETEESWQLPSPPKAFKDSTPDRQEEPTDVSNVESSSINTELIDKLKVLENQQQQMEETNSQSDNTSTISEDRLILSKLSLENLEKRKSLVYNRELATSLKLSYDECAQEDNSLLSNNNRPDQELSRTFNNFEKTYEDIQAINRQNEEKTRKIVTTNKQPSTLPNFKITTYDEPKQKIKVFEDDTIRSNSENAPARSVTLDRSQSLHKTSIGRSMENILSYRPSNNVEELFKRPKDANVIEPKKFRPKSEHISRSVNRSGSFSTEPSNNRYWSPSKPVTRSKSQVAVKKDEVYMNGLNKTDAMSKSSSLFDVSGLQSLEVMRQIQFKLNTPTTSMETLTKLESEKKENVKTKPQFQKLDEEEKKPEETTRKRYQYAGPPSINMTTWSERPKLPVNVKQDADYKLGVNNRVDFKLNNNNNDNIELKQHSRTNVNNNNSLYSFHQNKTENRNVTIKVNGAESTISTQKNGNNVLIKIGDQNNKFQEYTEVSYRAPSSNITTRSSQLVRPHSVALPSDFDISRVPVVRSVELKKNLKDQTSNNNKSITHLNHINEKYFSNENLSNSDHKTSINNSDVNSKPVFRTKSFLQPVPVVKGFRSLTSSDSNNRAVNNRHSWQPNSSNTLPAAANNSSSTKSYTTNQNVPFSKFNLRRTESTKIVEDQPSSARNDISFTLKSEASSKILIEKEDKKREVDKSLSNHTKTCVIAPPPPPPQMPKVIPKRITNRQFVPVADPRDELLKSIRDFGGKKGLRSRKIG